jgi:kinetochore protein Spc24
MVLLEEPPQKLIASVAENFNISSDVASIVRINSNLHTLQEARGKRLKDSRHLLRLLSRKVSLSKQAAEDAEAQEKERTHGDDMVRLDRDKFALAKSVNELESQSHNLEGQLARLREELEAVDREDPAQTALMDAEDGTL